MFLTSSNEILTNEGFKTAGSLKGKIFYSFNGKDYTKDYLEEDVYSLKIKYELQLENSFYITLIDGCRIKTSEGDKSIISLKQGDKVDLMSLPIITKGQDFDEAELMGLMAGQQNLIGCEIPLKANLKDKIEWLNNVIESYEYRSRGIKLITESYQSALNLYKLFLTLGLGVGVQIIEETKYLIWLHKEDILFLSLLGLKRNSSLKDYAREVSPYPIIKEVRQNGYEDLTFNFKHSKNDGSYCNIDGITIKR